MYWRKATYRKINTIGMYMHKLLAATLVLLCLPNETLATVKSTHLTCTGASTIHMKSGISMKPQANTIHVSVEQADKRTILIWGNYEHEAIASSEWYEYHYNKQDNINTPTYGIALNRYDMSITSIQAYNDKEISSVIFKGVCSVTGKPLI